MEEHLLGFDVRQPLAPAGDALWGPERRAVFLLRVDVAQPLSVDPMVWPSMFDSGEGIGLAPSERRRLGLAGVPLPAYTGLNAGLWENASAMLRYLAAAQPASGGGAPSETGPALAGQDGCSVVAVSVFAAGALDAAGLHLPHLSGSRPAPLATAPAPAWQRLGYDVADGSRVSGLSNCGFGATEAAALRSEWVPLLNEAGLFDDPRMADAFRLLADRRVPEHAPFFVYGLYLVRELIA